MAAVAEARFGFKQALEAWAENDDARAGFERAKHMHLEIAIGSENLGTAKAVLKELDAPTEAETAAVASLEKKLAERSADAEAHRELRHESDLAVGADARKMLLLGLVGVGLLVAALAIALRFMGFPSDSPLMRNGPQALMLTATTLGFVVGRKQLLQNQINRRLAALLVGTLAIGMLHRIEGTLAGDLPDDVMRGEMLITCASVFMTAVFVSRAWLVPTVFMLVANLVTWAYLPSALPVYVASHLAILLFVAFTWSKPAAR